MADGTNAHGLRRALARAEAGKALSTDEVASLLQARGPELERLMKRAAHLRELGHGRRVTYSRKVFIPLTMLCRDHCHYCTFAKPPARLEEAGDLEGRQSLACLGAGERPAEPVGVRAVGHRAASVLRCPRCG